MSAAPAVTHSTDAAPLLRQTPLAALHRELGAKLVPFAGYEMPVSYATGIVKEHAHVRERAGLFDVSHMGQARIAGPDFATVAAAFERLVPGDISGLKPGQIRYTQLLNEDGGIIDDLMATREPDGNGLFLVVNASRKEVDFAHIAAHLPLTVMLAPLLDRALIALQGPDAARVLARLVPGVDGLAFMTARAFDANGAALFVSRSGYTGEDGFEISLLADAAEAFARRLLAEPEVAPIGLGARDTLRLEAGLPLYGQDMDETTSPVEAALDFSIGKRRRRDGGFIGAERIQRELVEGPARVRIGLRLEGRSAARTHMKIASDTGETVGEITSGAYTPTAAASIAFGYVPLALSNAGTPIAVEIRGAFQPARVAGLPFVPHRYVRKA